MLSTANLHLYVKGGEDSTADYARFVTLAIAMENVLGDTCAVGDYSHFPEAVLLKKWCASIPSLIDYAVTCTDTEAEALRTTFLGLCRVAMVRAVQA